MSRPPLSATDVPSPCASAREPARPACALSLDSAEGGPLHVLVAEDDPINQLITRRLLEGFGCRVEVVADGQQAVEAAERHGFDVIVMDVVMPVLDGVAATRAIRAAPGGGSVPIVAVSGNAYDTTRNACATAGATAFLPKPFTRAALFGTLSAAVRGVAAGS